MRNALALILGTAETGAGHRLGPTLVAHTAGNLVLNVGTMVLNFAITFALTRQLGVSGYGAFAFASAWALLLGFPATLGLPPLVVREVAAYRVTQSWGDVRGLLRRANQVVVAASLAVGGTALGVSYASGWPSAELHRPTLLALALIPLTALVSLRQSAILGFGRVVLARLPEALVGPAILLLLIVVLTPTLDDRFSASWAIGANIAAMSLAAALGVVMLRRTLPADLRHAPLQFETGRWARLALPLVLFGAIQAVNVQIGTVLVGALGGSREAGIYSVANRAAGLIAFVLLGAMPALMPVIAELHARRDLARLQMLLTRSSRLVFVSSFPIALGVIVFAGPLLRIFGLGFDGGADALRIIAAGQLVNIAFGYPGTALVMTGHAAQLTGSVAAGAALNLALSAALVPGLGAEGAAVATAVSVAGTNGLLALVLWRQHRLFAPALALPGLR